MERVEVVYVLNGTTQKRTFVGTVESSQITPNGIGNVRFIGTSRDDDGRYVKYFSVRQCESITRYEEPDKSDPGTGE